MHLKPKLIDHYYHILVTDIGPGYETNFAYTYRGTEYGVIKRAIEIKERYPESDISICLALHLGCVAPNCSDDNRLTFHRDHSYSTDSYLLDVYYKRRNQQWY